MAAEYRKVPIQAFPRLASRTTAEDRFWKRLRVRVLCLDGAKGDPFLNKCLAVCSIPSW
jgi:hypothetical protein